MPMKRKAKQPKEAAVQTKPWFAKHFSAIIAQQLIFSELRADHDVYLCKEEKKKTKI